MYLQMDSYKEICQSWFGLCLKNSLFAAYVLEILKHETGKLKSCLKQGTRENWS